MIEKIEPIPRVIPETLRHSALQSKLIPFIGAGVSQLGGCPSWDEFANKALHFFVENNKLNHAQFNQISFLPPRVKLSVALELEKQHELRIDFGELLKPSATRKEIGDKVYADLSRLATMFVTTNYDDWLDQDLPMTPRTDLPPSQKKLLNSARRPFYKRTDISLENIDVPNATFHIHGSIVDRESMVLTTVDYLDRYSSHRIDGRDDSENRFLTFLQTLFRLKNVLFIGYGLNEMEVLEYVIEKGVKKTLKTNEEPRHYVLQGFFSHEIELARSLEGYFRQFGIGLLPFSRDELDWDQLVEVIAYLAREIPPGPPLLLPKRREMEELLL